MAELQIEVSETVLFYEYCQGNLFNGLEYDETVEESLDLAHAVYHVWNDLLDDTIGFEVDFTPNHFLILGESLLFLEQFGLPIRVSSTNLSVIHEQRVRQVDIAYLGLEVIHGIDVFWEEVSSAWHGTSFTKGVPYYWLENGEWLNVDDYDIVVRVNFATALDRLNMRHDVQQFYNFNNIILDQFFGYDWIKWAWGVISDDGFLFADTAVHYLGFHIHEYLFAQTSSEAQWKGEHLLSENAFIYDASKQIQGYENVIGEVLNIEVALRIPYLEKIISNVKASEDLDLTNTITTLVLNEFLKAQAAITIGLKVVYGIQENLPLTDSIFMAMAQDYLNTIEDGFGISVESAVNFITFNAIQEAILNQDDSASKSIITDSLLEAMDYTGDIK